MLQPLPCRFSPTDLRSPKQEAAAVPRSLSLTADNKWWEGRAGPQAIQEANHNHCWNSWLTLLAFFSNHCKDNWGKTCTNCNRKLFFPNSLQLLEANLCPERPQWVQEVSLPTSLVLSLSSQLLHVLPRSIFHFVTIHHAWATLQLCLKSQGSQPESRNLLWAGQQPAVLSVPGMQSPFLSSPGSLQNQDPYSPTGSGKQKCMVSQLQTSRPINLSLKYL